MPFYKKLFHKPVKYLAEQYRLSREAEEKVAKKFGVVPMLTIGGVGKVVKTSWEFLPRKQIPGEILKVIRKGEKLTDHEIVKRVFAKGYRTTMEEMSGGLWELTKKGTLGKTKEVSRLIKSKELERIGKGLGVRFTKTIKPARFFKK